MFRSGHNCLAWSDLDLHWEFPEGDLERDGCRWDQFTSCRHYRHHPHHCNHHHSSSPPKCRWVGLPVIIIITINTIFISDYTSCSSTYRQDQFTSYHHFFVVIVVIIVVILLNLTSKGRMQVYFLINTISHCHHHHCHCHRHYYPHHQHHPNCFCH